MQDGIVFAEFNHQGGDRGVTEFTAPNWWMGMASRETAQGRITLTSMCSLEPATVGREGYRELFQRARRSTASRSSTISIRTISSRSSRRCGGCRSRTRPG